MGESVDNIIEREQFWCKWKENKCFNFEKQPMNKIKERSEKFRKRDHKLDDKLHNKRIEVKGVAANLVKNG